MNSVAAMAGSDFVKVSEAAKLLGVSAATIRRMIERGALRADRTEGGHRLIPRSEVERLRGGGGVEQPQASRISVVAGHRERAVQFLARLPQVQAVVEVGVDHTRLRIGEFHAVFRLDGGFELIGESVATADEEEAIRIIWEREVQGGREKAGRISSGGSSA